MGVLGYVFVRTEELFMLSGVWTAFGGLASATIQAAFTKQIPAERVGSMLGAMGLLHAVSRVIAPIIFDGIYAGTIEVFPQTFVVVLAALFGLSCLASIFVRPHCEFMTQVSPFNQSLLIVLKWFSRTKVTSQYRCETRGIKRGTRRT
jgi:drug/metabolite transporter (DMT)-like permease